MNRTLLAAILLFCGTAAWGFKCTDGDGNPLPDGTIANTFGNDYQLVYPICIGGAVSYALPPPFSGGGTVSSAGTTVTGTGTNFLMDINVGDTIFIGTRTRTVQSISDATHLTVNAAFTPNLAAGTAYSTAPGILIRDGTNGYMPFSLLGDGKVGIGVLATAWLDVEPPAGESVTSGNGISIPRSVTIVGQNAGATSDASGKVGGTGGPVFQQAGAGGAAPVGSTPGTGGGMSIIGGDGGIILSGTGGKGGKGGALVLNGGGAGHGGSNPINTCGDPGDVIINPGTVYPDEGCTIGTHGNIYLGGAASTTPPDEPSGNVIIGGGQTAAQLCIAEANSATGTGTISSSGGTVTGVGTAFNTQVLVGDAIIAAGEKQTVQAVTDDTHLTTNVSFSPVLSGATFIIYRTPVTRTKQGCFVSPATLVNNDTYTLPDATGTMAITTGVLTNTHLAVFDASSRIIDGGAPPVIPAVPALKELDDTSDQGINSVTEVQVVSGSVTVTSGKRLIIGVSAKLLDSASANRTFTAQVRYDGTACSDATAVADGDGYDSSVASNDRAMMSYFTTLASPSTGAHTFRLCIKSSSATGTQTKEYAQLSFWEF